MISDNHYHDNLQVVGCGIVILSVLKPTLLYSIIYPLIDFPLTPVTMIILHIFADE